jgi:hypothetical protein
MAQGRASLGARPFALCGKKRKQIEKRACAFVTLVVISNRSE